MYHRILLNIQLDSDPICRNYQILFCYTTPNISNFFQVQKSKIECRWDTIKPIQKILSLFIDVNLLFLNIFSRIIQILLNKAFRNYTFPWCWTTNLNRQTTETKWQVIPEISRSIILLDINKPNLFTLKCRYHVSLIPTTRSSFLPFCRLFLRYWIKSTHKSTQILTNQYLNQQINLCLSYSVQRNAINPINFFCKTKN
jgi:hypothetical protein